MNTFLPYPDYADSAACLDNKRLGKQRVEVLQILQAIFGNSRWENHPAVKMWLGYGNALVDYGIAICEEWTGRGFKDQTAASIEGYRSDQETIRPHWLGDEKFHASQRSNLLRKDPIWYGRFGWTDPHNLPYNWPTGVNMQRREFLMLAHAWNPLKHKTESSFYSEKLDGIRCVWIPETRGMEFQKIPFANTNKDERAHVCTGLWSRYAKPIFAPDWFLNELPDDTPLDGELYTGRGNFQRTISFTKKIKPIDSEWSCVRFCIFDIPSYVRLLEPGRINTPNFAEKIIPQYCNRELGIDVTNRWYAPRRFMLNWQYLSKNFEVIDADGGCDSCVGVLRQTQLPTNRFEAERIVDEELTRVTSLGGEGLILRRPHSEWLPKRTDEILKVKKMHDAEGTVVGFTYGVGKLHGMLGSVRLRADLGKGEVEFDLSGYTDSERSLRHECRKEANFYPGKYVTEDISEYFPLGSKVTFKYRELTNDGKPKEARYLRPYNPV